MGCLLGSAKRYLIFFWLLLSVGLLINGCEETRIAWRCTTEPVAADVEQIEQGIKPGSDYLTLGPHLGVIDGGVYEYTIKKGHEKDAVTDATPITKLYYPVFSKNHPLARGEDPARAAWFKVLIETTRYKTVGEVKRAQPEGSSAAMGPITGVVINTIDPLSQEERRLLQEGFPSPVSAGWPVAAGSIPPPHTGSMPIASASFAPGARVCITRNGVSYFGSVLKAQDGQVYVNLDDGRKVWLGQELVTFA